MKKFLTSLFVLLTCILCISLAACVGGSNKLKISFETNVGPAIEAVEVDKGTEYTLPVPEYEGYEFEGWYLDEKFTGSAVEKITVRENITVYAKWAKIYTVKLDADGGTLSGSLSFKLKEGASLYEAVKNYVPTKADHKFEAWHNSATGGVVTSFSKMPPSDVTLTAIYKIKYTIEIYKQNFTDATKYDKAEDLVEYGPIGEIVFVDLPTDVITGFSVSDNSPTSIKLSANASENVCKVYLDRDEYTVTFHANYPDGKDANIKIANVLYGADVVLPNDVVYGGYCLTGWALSPSGAVAYKVDSVTGKLFTPGEGMHGEVKDVTFKPSSNMALYAVWTKGYVDMFGGGDTVYVFNSSSNQAYLCRNGIYFLGEYTASSGMVKFTDEKGVSLEGKLVENGAFVYYDGERAAAEYSRYAIEMADGKATAYADGNVRLQFDGFNGITYTVKNKDNTTYSSKGSFSLDEYGYYVSTFTSGDLAGQTLTIWLTEAYTGTDETTPVFRVRNDDEYELALIYCGVVYLGQLVYYDAAYYGVYLSGFNIALCFTGSSYMEMIYFIDGDSLTLIEPTDGSVYLTAKLDKIDDVLCYFEYTEEHDLTATNANNRLVLDGYGNAAYTVDGATVKGLYTVDDTGFGDYLVTMFYNGEEYANFIVTKTTGAGGAPAYTYAVKPVGYAEFVYTDDEYIYSTTYLVFNDEVDGKASIYFTDSRGTRHKISAGEYEFVNGLYVYNCDYLTIPEGVTVPFESKTFTSFVFTLGTKTTGNYVTYYVMLWTEYSEGDGNNTTLYTEYAGEKEGETLALLDFGAFAIYSFVIDGETLHIAGTYSVSPTTGVIALNYSTDSLYFKVDEKAKTFRLLDFAPYSIYFLTPELAVNENVYISFAGIKILDDYVCTYNVVGEDGEITSTSGMLAINVAESIYVFTSDDGDTKLNFMLFTTPAASYFSAYNGTYAGRYVSETYGVLTLDGYGANASLNGDTGMYMISDGLVVIMTSDGFVYVDVDQAGKSFTVRDSAFGSYLLGDNRYYSGYVFSFDGYGVLKIYSLEDVDEDGNITYTVEDGSYEINGDKVTVHYTNGTVDVDREGVFGTYTVGGNTYRTFCFTYGEIANTYVSTSDWSVIALDGVGNAVKYGADGQITTGSYVIVTDSLFYFVNDDATDAALYRYDTVTAMATPLELKARGYYAQDMQAIVLSKYGFAIINDSNSYYYEVDGNDVVIYRRAEENESGANKYGYVKDILGGYATAITYGDKTYYFNAGNDVIFNRNSADAAKYPANFGTEATPDFVTLEQVKFTPSAESVYYSVSGTAVIGGKNYDCVVSRDSDGEQVFYVTVGSWRFTVDFTYSGASANEFTVNGLASLQTYFSDIYLTYSYAYSVFFGTGIGNSWGVVQLMTEYGEDGGIGGHYVTAAFGASSNAYDVNGELLWLDKVEYEYDEETGIYTAELEHTDGYVYTFGFEIVTNGKLNEKAYRLLYITRCETFMDDTYKVELYILVGSDVYDMYYFGSIFAVGLYDSEGEEIDGDSMFETAGGVYYICRDKDVSGKIISTTYYFIELTPGEWDETSSLIPVFKDASVSKLDSVTTYYDEAGTSYADVDTAAGRILYVCLYNAEKGEGEGYAVTTCTHSEEDGSYKVTLTSGQIYTIKVSEGKIVITENASEKN